MEKTRLILGWADEEKEVGSRTPRCVGGWTGGLLNPS